MFCIKISVVDGDMVDVDDVVDFDWILYDNRDGGLSANFNIGDLNSITYLIIYFTLLQHIHSRRSKQ